MAVYRVPSHSVTLRRVVTLASGAAHSANTVTLKDFTVTGATPDMIFVCNPEKALDTGLALGAPYCVTLGHVIVPFINATAGTVTTAADLDITLIAL